MGGKRLIVRVCDLCNVEGAEQHSVVHNGRAVELDLCPGHAEPLEELMERFALASPKAPGRSTSPHRCTLCNAVLSRRSHAVYHVQTQHGYSEDEAYAHIRPVAGERVKQELTGPSHRPHRCKVCKKPYVNSGTARRHVQQQHPDNIKRGKTASDYITPIEQES